MAGLHRIFPDHPDPEHEPFITSEDERMENQAMQMHDRPAHPSGTPHVGPVQFLLETFEATEMAKEDSRIVDQVWEANRMAMSEQESQQAMEFQYYHENNQDIDQVPTSHCSHQIATGFKAKMMWLVAKYETGQWDECQAQLDAQRVGSSRPRNGPITTSSRDGARSNNSMNGHWARQ